MRTSLIIILFTNIMLGQTKNMETRITMTPNEFNAIGPYEDSEYLTFNYEETLFEHIRLQLLNINTSKQTYSSLTKGQKIFWGYTSLSSQIRNGGIAQYYWNTNGEYVNDLDLILKTINDPEFSKLVIESIETFKKNKELLINYKNLDQQPNSVGGYFQLWAEATKGDKLNNYFFSNTVKIEKTIFDYITSNHNEFIK